MSDRQYLRNIKLLVANDAQATDLSQLHIQFHITMHTWETPNLCEIRVFNLKDDTKNQIENEYVRVILSAGYEGQPTTTIFDGTIIQVRQGRDNPADTYTDIRGAEGDIAYSWGVIQGSLSAGSSYQQRLNVLAQALGIPVDASIASGDFLPPDKLPRGRTYFGMARDHLRDFGMATSTNWSIQNGVLKLIPYNGYLPTDKVVLNSASGLIGYPEQTENGIQVKSLLNPRLQVGGRVQINNADITDAALNLTNFGKNNDDIPHKTDDGTYRILKLEHSGDSRGNEYYSDMICVDVLAGQSPAGGAFPESGTHAGYA